MSESGHPAKSLVVPSIEGRRLGDSLHKIPTRARRRAAIEALTRTVQPEDDQ